MNPDTNWEEQQHILALGVHRDRYYGIRLSELRIALGDWLRNGGAPPAAWGGKRTPPRRTNRAGGARPSQKQMYYQAGRQTAGQDEVFLDMMRTNPISKAEFEILRRKRPELWERYAGYFDARVRNRAASPAMKFERHFAGANNAGLRRLIREYISLYSAENFPGMSFGEGLRSWVTSRVALTASGQANLERVVADYESARARNRG